MLLQIHRQVQLYQAWVVPLTVLLFFSPFSLYPHGVVLPRDFYNCVGLLLRFGEGYFCIRPGSRVIRGSSRVACGRVCVQVRVHPSVSEDIQMCDIANGESC